MRLNKNSMSVMERCGLQQAGYPLYTPGDGGVKSLYRVMQSAGYEDIFVAHHENSVVMFQRGKEPIRMEPAHAMGLGNLLAEWHTHREDTRGLSGIPNCDAKNLFWSYLGRDNGNFGDWTLSVAGRKHWEGIQGSSHLDEMSQALLGK